ncbi:glycerol-3-phosphate dehydrogenase [Escherichia coli]|uniref:Glycerol-3-phosphate dehydrogenase n=1 Tax=Escherichia coli TaxID=562 RepID=A0A447X6A7_ECOLX|nr:glycerol-3-phosphate dehydrogenase [Escherichia coli]
MNQRNASMTVIGAGSYGTALAITLARNGHEVVLWGHDPEHIATLERDRCNAAFLPDVPFPNTLHLESDLATALAASRNILVVVPSHVFGEVLRQIKPLMRPDARLVWATKGLEAETGRLLQDVAREALGDQIPLALSLAQRLRKNWRQVYRRLFRWPRPTRPLPMISSSCCTAAKVSAFTATRISLACSLAAR